MAGDVTLEVDYELLEFVACDAFDAVLRSGDQPITKRIYVWGLLEMTLPGGVSTIQAAPLVPQGSLLVPLRIDEDYFIRVKPHAEGLCDTDYDMARELARMERERCEKPVLSVHSSDEPSAADGSVSSSEDQSASPTEPSLQTAE